MLEYQLEYLFTMTATLDETPEFIGEVSEGLRVNFRTADGLVEGPKLRGRLCAGAVDWFVLRRDGVGLIDVRGAIQTHDGAWIAIEYTGVADTGARGYERFLQGEVPGALPMRAALRLETSQPDYMWLNRIQCLAIGESDMSKRSVRYDVHAVR